ncbi:N-acylneuraminate cytidylyltransferase/CMP-N,N'-diacetyllegionaminic acid synthase [Roseivirga ehrenbergii]|uniref:Acylneuraminate cytidylyltransferase n=1 Tax=Roseivirga ehrenbergii (strain DSM 102268 / JCM 13514 / KCTC 12282 / NCIMB 14502 / KMM 6017) TaxID=279360 RepID=A0A150XBZ5_ROSEK|nr:acylneuraminate cytidylyltransferase family protein [Roseivirga ehrenbergii]KYG76255.1 hypothetical protein MB14_03125 [Roseivirga ehrenbergii]TCL00217.1 N-acylneuraminate cytidylyltransferase/CMP-N,N'-diacetyllegionaminic acid synthase [Roseivirga ehrenbergii]
MKVVAFIPARGGSKGLPGKNIKPFAGKPLIAHTIKFALDCGVFDEVIVSTDDEQIKEISESYGARVVLRPDYLAEDGSLVVDAVHYTLGVLTSEDLRPDFCFLLECTSPFRTKQDVKKALEMLQSDRFDSVASFKKCELPPTRIWKIEGDTALPFISGADPFLPRQQQEEGYELTGEIYGFNVDRFIETHAKSVLYGKFFPLQSTSKFFAEIDTEIDFEVAEYFMKRLLNENDPINV